jgi:hypothetical protein
LEGPQRRLRLGCKEAIDRAWIKPEVFQVPFGDVDIASAEEAIEGGVFRLLCQPSRRRAGASWGAASGHAQSP